MKGRKRRSRRRKRKECNVQTKTLNRETEARPPPPPFEIEKGRGGEEASGQQTEPGWTLPDLARIMSATANERANMLYSRSYKLGVILKGNLNFQCVVSEGTGRSVGRTASERGKDASFNVPS